MVEDEEEEEEKKKEDAEEEEEETWLLLVVVVVKLPFLLLPLLLLLLLLLPPLLLGSLLDLLLKTIAEGARCVCGCLLGNVYTHSPLRESQPMAFRGGSPLGGGI